MNKIRRNKLSVLQDQISEIMSALEELRDEEEYAYENLPESIQESDRGCVMSDAIDNMDEAMSLLEDVSSCLDEAKGE